MRPALPKFHVKPEPLPCCGKGFFCTCRALADAAVVLDIYGAREQPVEGITSRIITDKMPADMQVIFEPDFSAAARDVVSVVEPGDVVLTIGAGSVTMVAAEILDELRAS